MERKLSHWAAVLLMACSLLGGAAAPGRAQGSLEIQLLTTNRGSGEGAQFVPGEVSRYFFRASLRSHAVLTLQRPNADAQTLVDQTIEGGVTYFLDGIIGSDLGERMLTLTVTAGDMTDTETITYNVVSGGDGSTLAVTLLTTNKGCGDTVTFAPGEGIRFFFRVTRAARVMLTVQRQDGQVQTLVDANVQGGFTYAVDGIIGADPGLRTFTLTATAGGMTASETCTYNVAGDGNGQDLQIQLLTTNKGSGATFRVGEGIRIFMRVSRTARVTLTQQRQDEDPEPILTDVVLQGGVTYALDGAIGPRTGMWNLNLRATAGSMSDEQNYEFTVVP